MAAEVAFLTMDLDYNGYFRQAEDFTRSYLKYSGDTDMKALLNFYRCYYAYVRGKVISFRLDQQEIATAERTEIKKTSSKYFDLAYTYAAHLEKPALILTAGLIGSGKSYQARNLAGRLGVADVSLPAELEGDSSGGSWALGGGIELFETVKLELFFSQLGSDLGYEGWAMRLLYTF